jgi:hypothetical protein
MEICEFVNEEGFWWHCEVAALIINELGINPHTKHHIRAAIREASNKVTDQKGGGKNIAPLISKSVHSRILQNQTMGFVLEHSVPVSYLNQLVLNLSVVTKEKVGNIIHKWTTLSVITEEEHQKLSALKLSKTMPTDWDGVNKLARYEKAGIELVNISYKDAIKNS